MDSHGGTSWWFPTDILVEILQRLPPNARRQFRLVCRRWRKLIDKRSFPHRSKTLVVTDQGSAFVVNVQTGRLKELWSGRTPPRCRGMRVVGTCNGLVCLCDDGVTGGAIAIANPVTGETLDLPPLLLPTPCHDAGDQCHRWHQAYSFGYNPTTGRYVQGRARAVPLLRGMGVQHSAGVPSRSHVVPVMSTSRAHVVLFMFSSPMHDM
ncbi:hypothetical protein QYE76_014394 [Lolium multiflorum]|uniref:F-box domain-containing protein n=1 Tax=Lolium multiflorum TaxID=4521 RepID=A0AAD8X844_LOLMU|nr:hypothetical protein QYE76_014394 [Lolium multiflorum]